MQRKKNFTKMENGGQKASRFSEQYHNTPVRDQVDDWACSWHENCRKHYVVFKSK